MEIQEIIKKEAQWFFQQEVGEVSPKYYKDVFESTTGGFILGAICMASIIKDVFENLDLKDDAKTERVINYLDTFIKSESENIPLAEKYQ